MVQLKDIRRYADRIAREFAPESIILFGSYADGSAGNDSDVDLLVIMAHDGRNVDQSLAIDKRISRDFPLDLLVRKPEEVRRRLALHDTFLSSIMAEGKVLYERDRRRVGRQSRRRLHHSIA